MVKYLFVVCVSLLLGTAVYQIGLWYQSAPRNKSGPIRTNLTVSHPLRFIAVGDTGTGGEAQLRVAAAMEKECLSGKLTGILLLGDNVYQHGVASLDDPLWANNIFLPYSSPCLREIPLFPVLGNHDYKGNSSAQIAMGLKEQRWRFPHRFYKVELNRKLTLLALDTNIFDICFSADHCVYDFVTDELAKNRTPWTLAFGHHPIRSANNKSRSHSGKGLLGKVLRQVFCRKNVLYISGHAHHLEHRVDQDCGNHYFISGGGGAKLYPTQEHEDIKFSASQHGFLLIEIKNHSLMLTFKDTENRTLHQQGFDTDALTSR